MKPDEPNCKALKEGDTITFSAAHEFQEGDAIRFSAPVEYYNPKTGKREMTVFPKGIDPNQTYRVGKIHDWTTFTLHEKMPMPWYEILFWALVVIALVIIVL